MCGEACLKFIHDEQHMYICVCKLCNWIFVYFYDIWFILYDFFEIAIAYIQTFASGCLVVCFHAAQVLYDACTYIMYMVFINDHILGGGF